MEVYCYTKQSATRDILKELRISEYSFPVRFSSICADCRTLLSV